MENFNEKLDELMLFHGLTETDLRKELRICQRALLNYKLSKFFKCKELFNTHSGFCYYFDKKPIPLTFRGFAPDPQQWHFSGFWYKEGALEPRIELLKVYIKAVKNYLK